MTWDTIVVGAGPAGTIAAIVLARAGARVLVLDRARFPRPKLCGDTVNPGAVALLRRLGLAHVLESGLRIDGMLLSGEPSVSLRGTYPAGVAGVSLTRDVLDTRLVESARASGATVEEGVLVRAPLVEDQRRCVSGVRIVTPAGTVEDVHGRIVIAADGHHSRIARGLGLSKSELVPRRWALGTYFESVAGLEACGEMHVRPDQYIGVAPLPGGLANVCVVTSNRARLRVPDLVQSTLRADAFLAPRFSEARMVARPAALGPLAVAASASGCPGLLLAGDSAGFIDPMTGDGLRFAMRGAELAAEEALRALATGQMDAHERLAHRRRLEFGAKWRFNRTLRSLVARGASVRAAALGARVAPSLFRHAIRYAGDVP